MPVCPLPVRAMVRDLLTDLLGQPVQVAAGSLQTLMKERPAYAATYTWDDGGVAAVGICDLTLAAGAAAAIGMSPAEEAVEVVEAGALTDDMSEFFHEVVNVLAKILNSPSSPHVKLRGVDVVPGEVRRDMADLVLKPSTRHDHDVAIEGYGKGTLTLLA